MKAPYGTPRAHLVAVVDDDEKQVEPRHDRHRHVDVGLQSFRAVVAAVLRVRRREDRGPRVEIRLDAGFGNRYSLLLHGLVDGHLVRRVHLVELVDAANAVVREH